MSRTVVKPIRVDNPRFRMCIRSVGPDLLDQIIFDKNIDAASDAIARAIPNVDVSK
jgi:hypothetical protein